LRNHPASDVESVSLRLIRCRICGRILADSEKKLQDFNERVLAGVAAKYGKNSNQYEKVGGVRKADRKRPASRKPSVPPSS